MDGGVGRWTGGWVDFKAPENGGWVERQVEERAAAVDLEGTVVLKPLRVLKPVLCVCVCAVCMRMLAIPLTPILPSSTLPLFAGRFPR